MTPIFITLLVTAPIIALATWLYLRRRDLSPRTRIAIMWSFFLFILVSWPIVVLIWHVERQHEMRRFPIFLSKVTLLWFVVTVAAGLRLFRLCRDKGEL